MKTETASQYFYEPVVIANEVKQSMTPEFMDCHVATLLAMTKGKRSSQ